MSGFLEVKLVSKPAIGLTPWKTWRKQWCILRPCPLRENAAIIALHTSAGMSATSSILLPAGSKIYRTASRSKKYAFGVFSLSLNDASKPIVFMSAQSESESQTWIAKLRALIDGSHVSSLIPSNRSFVVSLIENEFSAKLQLNGLYGTLCVEATGVVIRNTRTKQKDVFFCWDNLQTIKVLENNENHADTNKICILQTNSWFHGGSGPIQLYCLSAIDLIKYANAMRAKQTEYFQQDSLRFLNRRLSKSEGNLTPVMFKSYCTKFNPAGISTSNKMNVKWYDINDDIEITNFSQGDCGLNKDRVASTLINAAVLLSSPASQRGAISSLDLHTNSFNQTNLFGPLIKLNHGSNRGFDRRCSGASIASGIYEEISENLDKPFVKLHDNTYEVVRESHKCGAERLRRVDELPPPLPPRPAGSGRLDSTSDSGLEDDSLCSTPSHNSADLKWNTMHCSTGSLPRCYTNPSTMVRSKLSGDIDIDIDVDVDREKLKGKGSTFSVFRKRIKSDSRVILNKDSKCMPGYSTAMQDAKCTTLPRKKRFDFSVTPSKSINLIKNSRVGRVILRNMKSTSGSVKSNVVKSCEFLNLNDVDEIDSPAGRRCSRSVEHLEISRSVSYEGNAERLTQPEIVEGDVERGLDLSLMYENDNPNQAISHEVFELILKGRRLGPCGPAIPQECDYLPMSPLPAILTKKLDDQDYVVMSSPKIANVDMYTSITKTL